MNCYSDKNPKDIKEMFNSIAYNYDKMNNIITLGQNKKIKYDVVKNLKYLNTDQAKILDLCTGTGDIAGIINNKYPKFEVIGVDFSQKMLEKAREKYPYINFTEADCTELPFANDTFDACIISFGLRNIQNREKALSEINRILKNGGIFINLDLGKPNFLFNTVLKPYMYIFVALAGKIFNREDAPYRYLAKSNETFQSPKELLKLFMVNGFEKIKTKGYLFGQVAVQVMKKFQK